MRRICSFIAFAALGLLVVGCGGSGSSTPTTTTRVLAGFVYAKGNGLGSGPEVVVTTSANPPTGYFAPTSGTVTLSVANGSLTRAPDSEPFDMSVSNAIVVTATAPPSSNVSVSGSGITLNSIAKSLTSFNVNLGPISETGTVEPFSSTDAPSYTPGAPVSLQFTIDGNPPANPKELFVAGAPAGSGGDRTLATVALDSNGVINPSATFGVTSTTNGVLVSGTSPSFTLSAGTAANSSVEGDTTVAVQITGTNIAGNFLANFSYGTVGTITVTPGASSLLWNTAGAAATTTIDVTVKNTFNAAMFGKTVTLTDPGKVTANVWNTQAGATAFTAPSGPTDTTGKYSTVLTAPVSAAPGGGLTLTPKGDNTITGTVDASNSTATVKVIRPLSSVVLGGPTRIDVGMTTPGSGAGSYGPTSAVDVDGDNPPLSDYSSLSLTYTVTNIAGGAPFGNTGDSAVTTTSVSAIMAGAGNENRVVAGNVAGQFNIQVTGGVANPSNIVTTQVYGDPSKIFLTPDTNTVNNIVGALGNYSGSPGSTLDASFVLKDTANHTIPSGELNYTSGFILQAGTGGNVTSGGANVSAFTLTFGPNDGLLDIDVISGTWASGGGNRPFNLSKTIGHDSN
ncbi:MAG TPA: hypothetical protein VHE55_14930 [Fimbriimonadaceae bacterium]|nr:hypothetical protein [Fimbriimonadaceae bacterium]